MLHLEEAGETLLCLPPGGYSTRLRTSTWNVVQGLEGYGQAPGRLRPPVPSAAKITRMDEALSWLALVPDDKYVLRRLVVTGPVGREVKLAAKDHPPRGPAGEPTGPAPFIELGLTPLALTPDGAFRAYVHCTYGMPCGRDGTWADHRLEQTVNGRAGKAITLAEFGEPSRLSVQLTVEPGKGGER